MRLLALAIASCILVGCGKPKADLSAFELHEAYREVSKADAQYKGKTIAVRGIVKSVGIMLGQPFGQSFDEPRVHLGSTKSGDRILVVCYFPPESKIQVESLDEGESVIIRGICDGKTWYGGVAFLSKCVIVR